MSALPLIEAVQRAGGAIALQGDRLRLSAAEPLPENLLQELRLHKAEVIGHLQRARQSALRAPAPEVAPPVEIVTAWAHGVARLHAIPPPPSYPAHAWQQLIVDAKRFLEGWAAQAAALGWPDWELFGCHRRAPWGRIQGMGLVLLLRGKELAALTESEAAIRTRSGVRQTYRRKPMRPARSRRALPRLGALVMAAVPTLERTTFRTSRLLEFCSRKELVAQTGHEPADWPLVVIRELIDNSLDATEEAGIAAVIKITVARGKIRVSDNGPGIPPETVASILDFTTRTSSREAYVAPDRGRQGNAIKCILAMPFVLDGEEGRVDIAARGIRHLIAFKVDQIRQEPGDRPPTGTPRGRFGKHRHLGHDPLAGDIMLAGTFYHSCAASRASTRM